MALIWMLSNTLWREGNYSNLPKAIAFDLTTTVVERINRVNQLAQDERQILDDLSRTGEIDQATLFGITNEKVRLNKQIQRGLVKVIKNKGGISVDGYVENFLRGNSKWPLKLDLNDTFGRDDESMYRTDQGVKFMLMFGVYFLDCGVGGKYMFSNEQKKLEEILIRLMDLRESVQTRLAS